MDVPVNYLAILLAAVSSMIVGTIWYLPRVFGNRFEKLSGVNPNKPKRPALTYILSFLASVLTAYVLAYVTSITFEHFGTEFLLRAVITAVFLWVGFTAARMLVHHLFESRPIGLYVITVSHELVTVLVMALIIGAFGA